MKSNSQLVVDTRKTILDMVDEFQRNAGHKLRIQKEDDFDDLQAVVDKLLEDFLKEMKK